MSWQMLLTPYIHAYAVTLSQVHCGVHLAGLEIHPSMPAHSLPDQHISEFALVLLLAQALAVADRKTTKNSKHLSKTEQKKATKQLWVGKAKGVSLQ